MDFHKIGQRIRDERLKRNISREKLAEILELSPNFIGQVERGEKKMSLETLIKISDILDVSLDYFVKGYSEFSDEKDELINRINQCTKNEILIINDFIKVVLPHFKQN